MGTSQINFNLNWSKGQSKEKRHEIDAFQETACRKKRDSG